MRIGNGGSRGRVHCQENLSNRPGPPAQPADPLRPGRPKTVAISAFASQVQFSQQLLIWLQQMQQLYVCENVHVFFHGIYVVVLIVTIFVWV